MTGPRLVYSAMSPEAKRSWRWLQLVLGFRVGMWRRKRLVRGLAK